jgi:serralysin
MTILYLNNPNYTFNDPQVSLGSDPAFLTESNVYRVDTRGDDVTFTGRDFTFAQADLRLIGLPASSAIPTGGTVTGFTYAQNGVESFTLANLSLSLRDVWREVVDGGSLTQSLLAGALAGNDQITLGNGNDRIDAGRGEDYVFGGRGNDVLSGGDGQDVAGYADVRAAHAIFREGGTAYVRDSQFGNVDILDGFETLRFADGDLALTALPSATPLEYIASYADLRETFGVNAAAGRAHLQQNGLAEGRSASFIGYDYIASHVDLINAFGADENAGAAHYIRFGAKEGRAADDFDAARYLANYADLRASFGTDTDAAAIHYINFGYAEGRTDDLWIG